MPRAKTNNIKVSATIDPVVLDALKFIATTRGTPAADLMREAIREYVRVEIVKERDFLPYLAAVQDAH